MTRYRTHPLAAGFAPPWAWGWGEDRYGVFAEIQIGEVVQRMRWILPGTFRMGSPESEAGRFDWEGPRHRVQLTEGFWLADTPCTQELWEEVMGEGENPSRFRSPKRPVERVSWEDCQRFLDAVEARQPGLGLRLPTEAQWEYACRAGTETATWEGDLEILGANNASLLDEIAWYGGNSGVDFDLAEEEAHDSSDWPEKQHPHTRAGTREVGQKRPNPWGLYDMLGNVWEWCSDRWEFVEGYKGKDRVDPEGDHGPYRVFRGGSWSVHARLVRAAYRRGFEPGDRYDDLGFRLSRGPDPGIRSGR
jgi:formylglycine-generating enzyme required for sulfatase activity